MADAVFRQDAYDVRMDWGLWGAEMVGAHATYAVVVDVLSFSTSVSVAADRGMDVLPFRWNDDSAGAYARDHEATLAAGRLEATTLPGSTHGVSLSPSTISSADGIQRLVLPSPTGSAIAFALRDAGCTVLAGCLRNRRAVADWLAARIAEADVASVCVIAAGERWEGDDSLRPAAEDLWGAGAIVQALSDRGVVNASPEAGAASAAFEAIETDLPVALRSVVSGRELIAKGFALDVDVAAGLDESETVPVLWRAVFRPERASP